MDIKFNPLTTAVEGLKRNEAKVVEAADAITRAPVDAQNAGKAAASKPDDVVAVSDEAVVSDAVRGAALPQGDGDLAGPVVDLLQASAAYKAALVAVKVTADVEDTTARLLADRNA